MSIFVSRLSLRRSAVLAGVTLLAGLLAWPSSAAPTTPTGLPSLMDRIQAFLTTLWNGSTDPSGRTLDESETSKRPVSKEGPCSDPNGSPCGGETVAFRQPSRLRPQADALSHPPRACDSK